MSQESNSPKPLSQNFELDDSLDFRSSNFDAKKALLHGNLTLLRPVQALDNVSLFKKFLPKSDENHVSITKKPKSEPLKEEKPKLKDKWASPLIDIMEKLKHGPTCVLYNCWKDQKRVIVKTRTFNGIYSICEGELIAFDKHLNLILRNITETFPDKEDKRILKQTFIKGDNVILISRVSNP